MPLHPAYRRPTVKPAVQNCTPAEPSDRSGKCKPDLHFQAAEMGNRFPIQTPEEGNRFPLPEPRRRYVHYVRPRCPECQSTHLKAYGTVRHGDDADDPVTRYSRCTRCGAKLIVYAE